MTTTRVVRPPDVPPTATIEAWCKHCKMIFIPDSDDDLEHGLCGTQGKIKGWWW